MPDASAIPFVNPDDPNAWADMQRKQMVADMLMRSVQQGSQNDPSWNYMRVVPKRGWAQNLSPLVTALMAGKAQDNSLAAQQRYFGGLFAQPGQSQGASPQGPGPAGAPQQPQAPQGPNWLPVPTAQSVGQTPVAGMSPAFQQYRAFGSANPGTFQTSILEAQQKQAQAQYANQIARIHAVTTSDDPVRDIKADPNLTSEWMAGARARGVDPFDGLTADNARQVMSERANLYRAGVGQPTVAPPDTVQTRPVEGGGIVSQDVQRLKPPEVKAPEPPTLDIKEQNNPSDPTQKILVPVQTKPGFYPATAFGGSAPAKPAAGAQQQAYPATATPDNERAALGAQRIRTSLATLQGLEQQGYTMPPSVRALVSHALEGAHGDGIIGAVGSVLQEHALTNALDENSRRYVTALTPLLQGAAASLARQGTTEPGQMASSFESLVPRNQSEATQVAQNRSDVYHGLLASAGPALKNPVYAPTLGKDYEALKHPTPAAANVRSRLIGSKSYYTADDGKTWYDNPQLK